MARRVYQNGFENGSIVPIGRSNASSFPKAPNQERKDLLHRYPICHLGAMHIEKQHWEFITKRNKKLTNDLCGALESLLD